MQPDFTDGFSDERPEATNGTDVSAEARQQEAAQDAANNPTLVRSKAPRKRKDSGHLHATRHAVLSRYPLEALRHLGEDVKKYRRLESRLRATLKPRGEIAEMFFDRFFSSYLRCLLAARLEASAFQPETTAAKQRVALPTLHERDLPTLRFAEENRDCAVRANFPPDIFRDLVLVQRYDSHFSRETFRTLSILLVLRRGGEAALEGCISEMLGARKQSSEG